jgi:flagellar biosynthesis GTPase FlhF
MNVKLKYFMWELLPAGAMDKPKLPVFLTSWVDKSSSLCMYTMGQICIWSLPHLKAGCWYIDYGKIYCPIHEDNVRKTCETVDSKGAPTVTDNAQEHMDEVEVDINLLPEKEKNKILKQRERNAKKAEDKEEREAHKAKDKEERDAKKAKDKEEREAKKGERAGKLKAVAAPSLQLLLTEASTATPSQKSRKQDASVAQLSMSRLQHITSLALMDSTGGALHIQEFLSSGSLLSTNAYFMEHNAFPKEWVDMKAFIEKVLLSSC